MKIEIIKSADNNPVAEFFSLSNTPETDKFKIKFKTPCGEKYWVPVEHSERMERERDDALSQIFQAEGRAERFCQERDEARDDFEEEKKWHNRTHSELVDTQCKLQDTNIELDRLRQENETLKEMLDMQTKIVVDSEMRLMKNEKDY